ncbi:hypothetical protein CASFOL_036509 [Castilleja foliolosa]|uniref:Fatty acyl-CoA reductase n=1 Tax=Castilleja foliolosa TaxID=1961234 RepID=A0ABD3BWD9_9LAMI
MLLTQSSFCIAPIKFSIGKQYSFKTKHRLFGESENIFKLRSRSIRKLSENYNVDTYLTYVRSKLRPLEVVSAEMDKSCGDHRDRGIGITDFFHGKNIFVTGATGLLGKALVEKLLRSTSVGKIYLLVKANDKETAFDRLSKEITQSELFKCVRDKHGISYDEYVREKLIPVVGNVCERNLGMDVHSRNAITEDVDVIIESAANTKFNDRYDLLLDANVNAPQRLMMFAKGCKKLKLFVHISTAYVNVRREGIIYEKPLADDEISSCSFPEIDVIDEIKLAMKSSNESTGYDADKELKRLTLERASFYGFNNGYQLSKAMGEMVLNEIRGDVPLLVIRPTVIEGSYKEPVPGWIQGNRMFDPVITSFGKGLLRAFLADPDEQLDIVPVDMVANATIAAIAKHGITNTRQLNVYHVGTGFVNPLTYSRAFEYVFEHFSTNPLDNKTSLSKIKYFDEFGKFSKYIRDETWEHINAVCTEQKVLLQRRHCKANIAYTEQLCKAYEHMGFLKARFYNGNTQKLLEEMSEEEKVEFFIDATKIDWRKYFVEIHIPGLRKYVLSN